MRYLLFTSLTALSLTTSAQAPDYVPEEGLIAWYALDGNATDLSGSENNGSLHGPSPAENRFGQSESCLEFNREELDYISTDIDDIEGDGGRSMAFWARVDEGRQGGFALSYGPELFQSSCNAGFHIDLGPGDCGFVGLGAGANCYQRREPFDNLYDLSWHHFVITYSGGGLTTSGYWIDGELQPQTGCLDGSFPSSLNTSALFGMSIGRRNDDNLGTYFDGLIDEVGVWSRELTPSDITALFNAEATVAGCTNLEACNYNPEANVDDGSCLFDSGVSWGGEIDSEGQLVLSANLQEWNQVEAAPGVEVYGGFGSHLYLYTDQIASWSNNKIACEQSGAQLASVLSEAENDFITQALSEHAASPGGAHIGASDEGAEGSWYWLDGSEWNYSNWSGVEPNNTNGGEHFGQMYSSGFWNDCRDNSGPDAHIAVCKRHIANRLFWGDENNASVIVLETPFQDSIHLTLQSDLGSCVQLIVLEDVLPGGITGCLDTEACNYSSEATLDDGSCHFLCQYCLEGTVWSEEVFGCIPEPNSEAFDAACMGDLNADGIVDIQDLLDFFQLWGDECQLEEGGPLDDTDIVWSCGDPLEYQGYDYETVLIGEQCWFAENLRSESYENGDVISAGLSDDEWSFTESGATAIYGEGVSGCLHLSPTLEACNEALAYEEYGFLYNWFAVDDQRGVCPSGWHVPFMAEFQSLSATLGGDAYAGLALKATSGWFDNGNGTNESGFDGLPGGFRHEQAQFENAGYDGIWWMNYSVGESAKYLGVVSYSNAVFYETFSKNYGFSIRCIQDPE